jgi:hypothetical protein
MCCIFLIYIKVNFLYVNSNYIIKYKYALKYYFLVLHLSVENLKYLYNLCMTLYYYHILYINKYNIYSSMVSN